MLEKDSKKPVKIDERIDTIDYLGFIDWGSTFGWWQANCEEDEKHVIIKSAVFENSLKLKDYSVYTAKDNSYQLERSRMRLKYVEASVNKAKELEKEEKEKEKKKIRPITADSIIKTEEKEEEEKETVKPIKHKAEDLSKEFDMMSGMLDDIFKPTPRLKKIERVNSEESAKSTNTVDEVKGRLFPGEPIIGIDDDLNFFIKNL